MNTSLRIPVALLAALGLALAAVPALAHYMGQPTVTKTDHGAIVTNPHGTPLYTYGKDAIGTSNCTGQCAKVWPPELAADDAQPTGEFTLITRPDGHKQWAYDGMPLYGFRQDKQGGEPTGDGVAGFHVATVHEEYGNMEQHDMMKPSMSMTGRDTAAQDSY